MSSPPQVDDGVFDGRIDPVFDQVLQAVLRAVSRPVEPDGQPGIEVGVVAQHVLHVLVPVTVGGEHVGIGAEGDAGAVLFGGGYDGVVLVQNPLTEKGALALLVPEGDDLETGREKVYGFGPHPVEAHGFLEDGGIVLPAGIHHRDAFHDLAQGDAPAVVAHRYGAFLDGDVDALALPHDKFVDGVVDDLLEQDVDTVVRGGSVAQFADVHPGAQADVFARREVDDLVFGISCVLIFRHKNRPEGKYADFRGVAQI